MTHKEERANWTDARSVAFRAAVKGWAFTEHKRLKAMADRAEQHAWLPEHHELLETIRSVAEGNQI